LGGIISFLPQAIAAIAQGGMGGLVHFLWERAKAGGAWILTAVSRLFDLIGGPELAEFVMHAFSKTTLLTPDEITAGEEVLDTGAIRWDQVRVAEGGFLNAVFALNKGRAFTSFHTINIPSTGPHSRTHREIMVHEMTHVYQYERAGSVYLGQAFTRRPRSATVMVVRLGCGPRRPPASTIAISIANSRRRSRRTSTLREPTPLRSPITHRSSPS